MASRNTESRTSIARIPYPRSATLAGLCVLYLGGIVYGSLIPFDFRAIDAALAWQRFQHIRYLDLGIGSRADWIANILLYLPLGMLLCALFSRMAAHVAAPIAIALALAFSTGAAIAIEYFQVYFAPRTVSLNDLLAEGIGALLGAIGYRSHPARVIWNWLEHLRGNTAQRFHRALLLYALAYAVLNLFPFDFVMSLDELRWKLTTPSQGVLFAPVFLKAPVRAIARLLVECGVTIPLGMLVALHYGLTRRRWLGTALAWGLVLGLGCELIQLLLASGVCQGASVVTRMLGVVAGARIVLTTASWSGNRFTMRPGIGAASGSAHRSAEMFKVPLWVASALPVLAGPYLLAMLAVTGWFDAAWRSPREAVASIEPRMFIPFFFHYFTSEAVALTSVLANAVMYAPIAAGLWLWARARQAPPPGLVPTLLAVIPLATFVEAGKLFVPGRHPDPSNLLIAAAAAAAAWFALRWFEESLSTPVADAVPRPSVRTRPVMAAAPPPATTEPWIPPAIRGNPTHPSRAIGALLLVFALWLTAKYPIGGLLLGAGLAGYSLALYRFPQLWLAIVPAALPVLDFADRTGWTLIDEFDLLLLVTIGMLLFRTGWPGWRDRHSRGFAGLLAAFGIAIAISLMRGLLPLEPWGPNAVFSYLSHYHAIRVGKGMLWALLFWPWARWMLAAKPDHAGLLVGGVLGGLALTCVAMLIERWSFVGLFDFSTGYRATGFFTSVNNGGGSIDGYLVLALPLVAACWLRWRSWGSRVGGFLLFAGGLYCLLVTFTRVDYLAAVLAGAILFAGLLRARLSTSAFFSIALPAAAISALIMVAALSGSFTQQRFANAGSDLRFRITEWRHDLALSDPGWSAALFGNGLGSFPRIQYLNAPIGESPAAYAIDEESGNRFLRLGYGTPVFILQRFARPLPEQVIVRVNMRGAAPGVGLGVSICEKSLLYSFRCASHTHMVDAAGAESWQARVADLDLRALDHRLQPVYFTLFHAGESDAVIEVDDVSVTDSAGRELLANGAFSNGADRWFFTSDDHLNWRIDSLWLHVLFEQGWVGVLLLAAVLLAGFGYALRGFVAREPTAAIALGSLSAFAVVALTESLVEVARIGFMLLLIVYLARAVATRGSVRQGNIDPGPADRRTRTER